MKMSEYDSMSIYQYFTEKMGCTPEDESLRELPVYSNCGDDCRKAIDRAWEFARCVEAADPDMLPGLITMLERTISIYWRG